MAQEQAGSRLPPGGQKLKNVYVFLVASFLSGLGGALGSIVGHAAGQTGLWFGGILGGLAGAVAAAFLSNSLGWIQHAQLRAVAIGGSLGFLAAALIAVNTLSSPVGPVASTALIGLGALLGTRSGSSSRSSS